MCDLTDHDALVGMVTVENKLDAVRLLQDQTRDRVVGESGVVHSANVILAVEQTQQVPMQRNHSLCFHLQQLGVVVGLTLTLFYVLPESSRRVERHIVLDDDVF